MKKMILGLAFMVLVVTSGFATPGDVSKKVLNSFRTEFAKAEEVSWTKAKDYYKAAFTLNGQKMFAYYTLSGDLMGLSRYISSLQLPMHLLAELKNGFPDYWITDLFEVSNADGTQYYVTLENSGVKLVLKSSNGYEWIDYDKVKKA